MTDRQDRAILEIEKALEAMTDELNAGRSGVSGLRAQAIAHTRQALLLLTPQWQEIRPGLFMPRSDA